jgi:hypothetical protein
MEWRLNSRGACDKREKLDFIDFSAPEYDYALHRVLHIFNFGATVLASAPRPDAKP